MKNVDLSSYSNEWYNPGRNSFIRILWYFTNILFFKSSFFPFFNVKKKILILFGAKIGKNVVIKPNVNIKYPWNLSVGNHVWIGEKVWIDSLCSVQIGDNVCISQGAYLLCGNHNYSLSNFDLILKNIRG